MTQIEITQNHQALVNQILAEREAEFNNHVAEATEGVADTAPKSKYERRMQTKLQNAICANAHIKGYTAKIVGRNISEKIGGFRI